MDSTFSNTSIYRPVSIHRRGLVPVTSIDTLSVLLNIPRGLLFKKTTAFLSTLSGLRHRYELLDCGTCLTKAGVAALLDKLKLTSETNLEPLNAWFDDADTTNGYFRERNDLDDRAVVFMSKGECAENALLLELNAYYRVPTVVVIPGNPSGVRVEVRGIKYMEYAIPAIKSGVTGICDETFVEAGGDSLVLSVPSDRNKEAVIGLAGDTQRYILMAMRKDPEVDLLEGANLIRGLRTVVRAAPEEKYVPPRPIDASTVIIPHQVPTSNGRYSLRSVHAMTQSKEQFSTWANRAVARHDMHEGVDFVVVIQEPTGARHGRRRTDYMVEEQAMKKIIAVNGLSEEEEF